MSDDVVMKLGGVMVAVAVAYSLAVDESRSGGATSGVPGSGVVLLLVIVVLGFIGRRAFEAWRMGAPTPRQPWVRRRPALPPPPDADGRNHPL